LIQKKPRQTLTFVLGIDISPARVSKQLRLTLQRNKYGSLFNFPGKPPVSVSPDATTTVNVVKKSTTKQTLRVSSEAHIALSAILDKALKEVVRDTIKYAIENKKKQIKPTHMYEAKINGAGWSLFSSLQCSVEMQELTQIQREEEEFDDDEEDQETKTDAQNDVVSEEEEEPVMRSAFNTYVENAIKSVKKNWEFNQDLVEFSKLTAQI